MNKYYILTTALILFSMTSFGQFKEKTAIDKVFAQWNKPDVPGGSVGVIQNGKLIYAKGYGMTNLEHSIPNSPKSVFRIGSTCKQFTAACIVLLAEQGKLSLEHTLSKFYPNFPAYANKITIRHLLYHTSGIRDYLSLIPLKGLKENNFYTDEEVMSWLVNQKELNFSTGEEYSYSNSGYWLLGQIVEKVSGRDLTDFARREIFEPLGMNHTHFHNDHTQVVKNRASGYTFSKGEYKISRTNSNLIGDGGFYTTVGDLKKWDDAFYESKVLSKKFWRTMTQSGVLNNGKKVRYAGGLFLETYRGLNAFAHGGSSPGFRAQMIRFPQQRFSVVVLANRADANPTKMAHRVADIFLQGEFPPRSQQKKVTKTSTSAKYIKLPTQKLKKYEGHYWHAKNVSFRKIYLKNDTLRYQRSASNENSLVPVGPGEFKMVNVGGNVIVKFEKVGQAKHLMKFVVDGETIATLKSYQPESYTNKALQKFAGNYYSAELNIVYKLKPKDKALALFIKGRELLSVKPVMKHLFLNLPDPRNGTLKFQANEASKVNGFLLSFWGAKNLKFVKQ